MTRGLARATDDTIVYDPTLKEFVKLGDSGSIKISVKRTIKAFNKLREASSLILQTRAKPSTPDGAGAGAGAGAGSDTPPKQAHPHPRSLTRWELTRLSTRTEGTTELSPIIEDEEEETGSSPPPSPPSPPHK